MWKKEFFNTYFNAKSTSEEINNVLEMKNKNIPPFLFKYTNTNHLDDLLINNLIYLPEISELNDPFEGNVLHDLDIQSRKYLRYLFRRMGKEPIDLNSSNEDPLNDSQILFQILDGDFIKRVRKQLSDMQKPFVEEYYSELNSQLKRNTKLLCLTTSNRNNPMWSHYATEHEGICIKYNTQKISEDLISNCFPVFYDDSNFTDDMELDSLSEMKQKLDVKPFLKKSKDWLCENEWRIILSKDVLKCCEEYHQKNGRDYLNLKPEGVYLGKDIPEIYLNLIIEICESRDIEVYQMKKIHTQYELVEKKL